MNLLVISFELIFDWIFCESVEDLETENVSTRQRLDP